MNLQRRLRGSTAFVLAAALFVATAAPLAAAEDKDAKDAAVPNSIIRGKVLGPDGKAAAAVEVFVYHLATEAMFSTTTNSKGEFELEGLPYGYFDLAAKSSDGLYVADQVANVGPAGKNEVEFRLQSFGASAQAERRTFPGLDEDPVGIARVLDQRMVGESFWGSPKGISIIAGGGALVLLAIAGGSEPSASPFIP